jgi:nitrous oxidase accessory protein
MSLALASGLALALAAPPPARPAGCVDVLPGELPRAVDAAAAGDRLCLAAGAHRGPVRVERPLWIWGPPDAVVSGPGAGSVVTFERGAAGSRLEGLTVTGLGTSFDREGAAVLVRADEVVVEGIAVEEAVFGVLVERARRVIVRRVTIRGQDGPSLGLRGDAIRLWETRGSLVEDNRVQGARDIVCWYSTGNRIAGNRFEGGRYGTHLMYSHDTVVEGNVFADNTVGVFVMYSRGVTIRKNRVSGSAGAAGMGIGLKDSGNITVEDNVLVDDTVGMYFDSSPVQQNHANRVAGNLFAGCDAGVVFLGGARGNTFEGNRFIKNRAHVRVDGGGDALAARWDGNRWDDYAGYDLDRDGIGDVRYELRRLSEDLVRAHPDLRLFQGMPALGLIDAAGRLLPLYEPKLVLVDARPRVREVLDHAP